MDDLLLRRKMMMLGSSKVPFIRNVGTRYIDTGITADSTVSVVIYAKNINPGCGRIIGTTSLSHFSSTLSYKAPAATWGFYGDNVFFLCIGGSSARKNLSRMWWSPFHKFEITSTQFKIGNETSDTFSLGQITANQKIYLFDDNGSIPIDISYVEIYKGGSLVRDFSAVPTGLYDSVSNTIFTGTGSGSFMYGEFDPTLPYIPIEYIECTGSQRIQLSNITTKNLAFSLYTPTAHNCNFVCTGGLQINNTGNITWPYNYLYQGSSDSATLQCKDTSNSVKDHYGFIRGSNVTYDYQYGYKSDGSGIMRESTVTNYPTPGVAVDVRGNTFSVDNSSFTVVSRNFQGRVKHITIDNHNFEPVIVNNVAGLWDSYNDVFYPSQTSTPFIAGPEMTYTYIPKE